ncbi:MAG: DUF1080 domain-containing protein [Planctomycetes bacterium]|nr:DUF1080 domain-containing protein [Planctomycetota bacterium]
MKTNLIAILILGCLIGCTNAKKEPIVLLDKKLSNFEPFIGIPHSTVKGLPEGTYQSNNVWGEGKPMGLNADIKNVFSVIEEDGKPVLRVSGEIFGGLTTKKEYENYHFSTKFKWGNKKWEPRLNKKLDSGLLYHCYGDHGRFWKVWKTCIEYQVQETDLGDDIFLGETVVKPGEPAPKSSTYRPIPKSEATKLDKKQGEWNLLEFYTLGNDSVHVVNGQVVVVLEDSRIHDGSELSKGQIQIQSEAAECFYKDILIQPIKEFPEAIRMQMSSN